MRYIKLSFKYLIKNALFLFLFSIIPAIFIGSLTSPFKFLEFINNYSSLTVVNFGDIFFSIIDISWLKVLFYVIGFALLSVCVSIIVGQIENHFRSGKKNFTNIKNNINNNVLVVLGNFVLYCLISFLLTFLSGTIIYLFHILIVGLSATANVGCMIIAIIVFTICLCANLVVGLTLMLNIPNMLYNGYTFKQSLSSTLNMLSKNFFNLVLAFVVPYIIIIPLISIFNFSSIALHIINVICIIISIMYYSSFVMTAYFDINNLSRYDNRKYYSIK